MPIHFVNSAKEDASLSTTRSQSQKRYANKAKYIANAYNRWLGASRMVSGIRGCRSWVAAAAAFSGAGGSDGLAGLCCLGGLVGVGVGDEGSLLDLEATVPGVCGKPPDRTRGVSFMAFRGGGEGP